MALLSVPAEFAVALRTGRLIRGWSRPQFASVAGVPYSRVRAFEAGTAVPSATEFTALWHALTSDPPPRVTPNR